jgi:hypothetical protein
MKVECIDINEAITKFSEIKKMSIKNFLEIYKVKQWK